MGIDDEEVRERLWQRFFNLAAARTEVVNVEDAAFEEVLRCKNAWFHAINEYMTKGKNTASDLWVGWRLRIILQDDPDVLLAPPNEELIVQTEFMDAPAIPVPPVLEVQMPVQPLGELPVALQGVFWRRIGSFFKKIWAKPDHSGRGPHA